MVLMTDRAGTMIGVATMRQGQARRATPKCFDCFEWRCRLSITRRRLDVDDHFRSIVLESICLQIVPLADRRDRALKSFHFPWSSIRERARLLRGQRLVTNY